MRPPYPSFSFLLKIFPFYYFFLSTLSLTFFILHSCISFATPFKVTLECASQTFILIPSFHSLLFRFSLILIFLKLILSRLSYNAPPVRFPLLFIYFLLFSGSHSPFPALLQLSLTLIPFRLGSTILSLPFPSPIFFSHIPLLCSIFFPFLIHLRKLHKNAPAVLFRPLSLSLAFLSN